MYEPFLIIKSGIEAAGLFLGCGSEVRIALTDQRLFWADLV